MERATEAPLSKTLVISERAIATALARERTETTVLQGQRDSLKNGIIIGAVVGGIIGAIGGKLLCAAFEEGNTPCWDGMLRVGAFGAAIGAGAGAGIDALAYRRTPLPARPERLGTHASRGVMRVRF
jgi:hypothetical protein